MGKILDRAWRRLILLGVPLALVLGSVLVLLIIGYPNAVFLWGDEVEWFAQAVNRRKASWGIIISVTVVGVLSKLLLEGSSDWLPK